MKKRILIGVGLCFLTALFAVPIKIYTQPANVSVYINGTLFGISDRNGVLSEMIFLNAGRYTFSAEKPGYNSYTEVLDISQATEVILKLLPSGILEVKTQPVDALIRVDERYEATGHFVQEIPEGRHYVEVSHPGYQSRYFYPEVKQYFTKSLEVILEQEGNTRFITEPAGAQVSVDGISAGVTPFQTFLVPGEHMVSFSKEWHTPQLQMIRVNSLGENQVFQRLEPYANVTIQSTPHQAEVYVQGVFIGEAPVTLNELPLEKVLITYRKEGYKEVNEEVVLKPGPMAVTGHLSLKTYPLTVHATPAALVYLDGEEQGITPITFQADHGSHRLSLKSGEKEWLSVIEILQPREVRVDLNVETTILFHFVPAGEGFVLHRGQRYPLAHPINTVAGLQTFDLSRSGYPDRRRVYKLSSGKVYEYTIDLEGEALLFLSTDPAEAQVYWMGTLIAETPIRGLKIRPGTGELRIRWLNGEWSEEMSFFDGQTYTLFRQLPGNTTLSIHSFPSGLPLWLNGTPSGLTPQTLSVQSGTYTVECEGPDGIRQKQIITLSGDVERTINFVF